MHLPNFETYLGAIAVDADDGKFHPGLQHGLQLYHWPNRKFGTEEKAAEAAQMALEDALDAANAVISSWNLEAL